MDNQMTLKIKAISQNESFARSAVAAFCTPLNPTVDSLGDLKTAVSEAVTNSIVHGYAGSSDGEVELKVRTHGTTVHIEVTDCGVGIENIELARKPFYTSRPDEERSGMGFTVMESFTDTLEVEHNAPHGLIVRMRKDLCTARKKEE